MAKKTVTCQLCGNVVKKSEGVLYCTDVTAQGHEQNNYACSDLCLHIMELERKQLGDAETHFFQKPAYRSTIRVPRERTQLDTVQGREDYHHMTSAMAGGLYVESMTKVRTRKKTKKTFKKK